MTEQDPNQSRPGQPDREATRVSLQAEVPLELAGKRLDQIAAQMFPDYSRGRLQDWIRSASLLVNGQARRPRDKLKPGDQLQVEAELEKAEQWSAEALPLTIVFEDEHLLVINKAANSVVHPAAGNHSGTLLNGLLHHCPQLEELPRAGIVHRLDKDTTGLLVVAKTLPAHTHLVQLLQNRDISREYEAVVNGLLTGGGRVDAPLDRHPVNRKKRAVTMSGKEAVTHYRLLNRFRAHCHLQVKLETGRTHQIRVHMAHINHPLVGDPLYGGRLQIPRGCDSALADYLRSFRRQALHARRLAFVHPASGEEMSWEAELPEDMQTLLQRLADDNRQHD
jgi:23S rRNA pseudouridine1911/1915/1917 synthase